MSNIISLQWGTPKIFSQVFQPSHCCFVLSAGFLGVSYTHIHSSVVSLVFEHSLHADFWIPQLWSLLSEIFSISSFSASLVFWHLKLLRLCCLQSPQRKSWINVHLIQKILSELLMSCIISNFLILVVLLHLNNCFYT